MVLELQQLTLLGVRVSKVIVMILLITILLYLLISSEARSEARSEDIEGIQERIPAIDQAQGMEFLLHYN